MANLKIVKENFDVQTVDMESQDWISKFETSLRDTGFAVLTNHGVSSRVLESLYGQWAEFFQSPTKFMYEQPDKNKGYVPFKTENAKGNDLKDLKEFYHVFLPFKALPKEVSIDDTKELTDELMKIARHLLFVLQPSVPKELAQLHGQPLHQMIKGSESVLLRVLHYPPVEYGEVSEGAVRAAAHEDINLITLLPAATQPGLEVRDLMGNWHKVKCDPGSIIVNAGDMLSEATGGLFQSTTHRVVNPEGANVSRYSMPLFVHPRSEVILSTKYTAGEYLDQRLKEIGLKK